MSGFDGGFSASSVQHYIQSRKDKEADEHRAFEQAAKAQRDQLHEEFLKREVRPDAVDRVAALVRKCVDRGEKQALLFQFPSDWLPDGGRSITSHQPDWHDKLDGFAERAYTFFKRELAPRGFQLHAEIVTWPDGMPGDVGFVLTWKRPEDMA